MPRLPAAIPGDDLVSVARSLLESNPQLAALAAVLGLLALVAAALLYRRLRRSPGERFKYALSKVDAVTVLMHPNPDPDAMATALGVKHVAETAGASVEIQYSGQIRHQENRAFRTVLGLEADSIDEAADLAPGAVVLVDHNEARGFEGATEVDPYAVVDHHPGDGTGSAFTDVRAEYGACASIVAEYFQELGLQPGREDANGDGEYIPTTVATGLLYGILADTNHLTRGCTNAEFEAAAFLYEGIDEEALDRIANPQVDAEVLEVRSRAISKRVVRAPYAVSDVGQVSNVDTIPQAADELLQLEGVSAVVVSGEKEGTLHLSGRSRDDRVHMGDALAAAVEAIPMSSAGGHARMGGGQVSVEHMSGLRPDSGMTREEFGDRLFDAMAGELD
jgi:nanoRNase/pAp phosphatase (c-di-AMP/oligoRNAs hydrolase)